MLNSLPWKQRSFCHFWDCTQILYFRFFCLLWGLLHFFDEILAYSSRYNGHLNEIRPFPSILVHWFLKCRYSLLPSPVWPLPIYLDSPNFSISKVDTRWKGVLRFHGMANTLENQKYLYKVILLTDIRSYYYKLFYSSREKLRHLFSFEEITQQPSGKQTSLMFISSSSSPSVLPTHEPLPLSQY